MSALHLCGPMAFRALQWCHPMLASTTRTSCCTRMITLYGAQKWIQARTILWEMLWEILWEILQEILWEILWEMPLVILQKIFISEANS